MSRVRFLHWNASEAVATHERLSATGFEVEYSPTFETFLMREWREHPPAVFLIDLSRLPSHGREIAVALRQSPKTRQVPIVFCGGAPGKVKLIRDMLPDASFCTDANLLETLQQAQPSSAPVKPASMMNRYASRTTAQKLGLVTGSSLSVIHAPANLSRVLGQLPEAVEIVDEGADVTVCFANSAHELRSEVSKLRSRAARTKFWIAWRKKSATTHTGVTEDLVRQTGLDLGLVDYKVCSLDNTWSAILFAVRKPSSLTATEI